MKILIVEDNAANMKLVSELLKRAGYEVLEAKDAETGLSIARKGLPALILMDIQLPGMDGLTSTKVLKSDEKTKHIPVIALTSYAMNGDEEKILEAGCDGYIPKPIKYKEFLEKIKSILNGL